MPLKPQTKLDGQKGIFFFEQHLRIDGSMALAQAVDECHRVGISARHVLISEGPPAHADSAADSAPHDHGRVKPAPRRICTAHVLHHAGTPQNKP